MLQMTIFGKTDPLIASVEETKLVDTVAVVNWVTVLEISFPLETTW